MVRLEEEGVVDQAPSVPPFVVYWEVYCSLGLLRRFGAQVSQADGFFWLFLGLGKGRCRLGGSDRVAWLWVKTDLGSHFGQVNSPPILGPILVVGLGCSPGVRSGF